MFNPGTDVYMGALSRLITSYINAHSVNVYKNDYLQQNGRFIKFVISSQMLFLIILIFGK